MSSAARSRPRRPHRPRALPRRPRARRRHPLVSPSISVSPPTHVAPILIIMAVGPHSAVEATSSAANGRVAGAWCIGSRV
uniref:Uncharacterized protein n=1 Tax=Arundo donax TaxID=35708 RepID=A0A0A9AU02_ARUDO